MITTVQQNLDQAEINIIKNNCAVVERRIENLNVACKYHQNVVDQKLRRLKLEDQYYDVLKKDKPFNEKSMNYL